MENKKKGVKVLACLAVLAITTVTIQNEFFPVTSALIWCMALFYGLLTLLKP
jgi:hypothetical protein